MWGRELGQKSQLDKGKIWDPTLLSWLGLCALLR